MWVLRKILLAVIALAILLAVAGFFLPRNVHVERSVRIDAPQGTVFAVVNGFRTFNRWSPWFPRDPEASYEIQGPDAGVGAKLIWAGDPAKVGSGSQEIVESNPLDLVVTRLDFGEQGSATARFDLARDGDATRVRWGFDTDLGLNPYGRYFGLMFDRLIGKDFEEGLAGLKTFVESLPKTDFVDLMVVKTEVTAVPVAYVAVRSGKDEPAIAAALGAAYGQLMGFIAERGLERSGPLLTLNSRWDESGYQFDAAIPVSRLPEGEISPDSPVRVRTTYSGPAMQVEHRGAYGDLSLLYDKMFAFAAAMGVEQAGPPWDEYPSDPWTVPEEDRLAIVYLPVRRE